MRSIKLYSNRDNSLAGYYFPDQEVTLVVYESEYDAFYLGHYEDVCWDHHESIYTWYEGDDYYWDVEILQDQIECHRIAYGDDEAVQAIAQALNP